MPVVSFGPCKKDILGFPLSIREDLADAIARLEEGLLLSMPLSRPMPSIGVRVHELRLRDRTGIYRVIYYLSNDSIIHILCGFKKTTQSTERRYLKLAKKRLKDVL